MALNKTIYDIAQSESKGYALTPGGVVSDPEDTFKKYQELESEHKKDVKKSVDETQNALNNVGGKTARGGNLTGNSGYLSVQMPYLIMSIPNISLPEDYGHYYGYPCNMTCLLGELSGFTVVKDCHLDGFSCTKTELDEIEALLKQGVIL